MKLEMIFFSHAHKELVSSLKLGILLWHLVAVVYSFSGDHHVHSLLYIEVHTVRPSSVELTWGSSLPNLPLVKRLSICEVIIWSSVDSSRNALDNYNLQDDIIKVNSLKEKTHYALFLKCEVNGTALQSNSVNFTTGSGSLLLSRTTQQPATGATRNDAHLDKNTTNKNYSINHSPSTNDDSPTIYKHKLSAFSNVLDATLGIMFAVIGGVVAIVTICYVWKGCRRRQRLQQFMRREDDSDQFAIIRQNIAESA